MIGTGWRGFAALCLIGLATGGPAAARACEATLIELVSIRDGTILAQIDGPEFALAWRHSVTLTEVRADYRLMPGRGIVQTAERFAAHGPGMAHEGAGWRSENGLMLVELDRDIDRLILRAAPEHENRLLAAADVIDLTQWPAIPLEIRAVDCKETE
ncbi:DUF1850 domain-containing protein [Natronohydrobacter thiooxidans]|uniref:DUF1850 domain-containing protein n=1 Tax=Natronohydrobacter thiooxidans TaxID=87172 RepID=UPI0008FF18D2|nr:DUF1850 domain-containing protein [Natronohydrobacter thiooxidans]